MFARACKGMLCSLMLLGLFGLPSCESSSRTERPQALTGQTDDERDSVQRPTPRPGRVHSKGLLGPP
jgi:hypothetical protein